MWVRSTRLVEIGMSWVVEARSASWARMYCMRPVSQLGSTPTQIDRGHGDGTAAFPLTGGYQPRIDPNSCALIDLLSENQPQGQYVASRSIS